MSGIGHNGGPSMEPGHGFRKAAWTRARLRGFVTENGLPPDGVVLVSATALERDWCAAAGLAGSLSAEAFLTTAE